MKGLLDAHASIHAVHDNGWSVLHFAAKTGDLELVQYLLQAGAKLDTEDAAGLNPNPVEP